MRRHPLSCKVNDIALAAQAAGTNADTSASFETGSCERLAYLMEVVVVGNEIFVGNPPTLPLDRERYALSEERLAGPRRPMFGIVKRCVVVMGQAE